jgi:hypothetical protein
MAKNSAVTDVNSGTGREETTVGHCEFREILTTADELEAILGKPNQRVLAKVLDRLDDICLAWDCHGNWVWQRE